jgi:glycosyltransferase involved in cell wall biosynthesis
MAAGKPVIASRLYGILKEFGENNGVVYIDKPEDTIKMAIDLIEKDMIDDLGLEAKQFVKSRSWDDAASELETILESLIK